MSRVLSRVMLSASSVVGIEGVGIGAEVAKEKGPASRKSVAGFRVNSAVCCRTLAMHWNHF